MGRREKYLEGLYGKPTPLTGSCTTCSARQAQEGWNLMATRPQVEEESYRLPRLWDGSEARRGQTTVAFPATRQS
jgi:hypothetical protein